MDVLAAALVLLLFGATALGKDVDIIHISTPRPQSVIQHLVLDHPPVAEVPISHGHEL